MIAPLTFQKFALGWFPALALAATVNPAPRLADAMLLQIGGIAVPPVTCLLGLLGVLMSRPLAKRRETSLSWPLFLLVSVIMLIVVELWIVEERPGALFAFVIAIGLGFSGYSLIELAGDQISSFIRRIIAVPTARLGTAAAAEAVTEISAPSPEEDPAQ